MFASSRSVLSRMVMLVVTLAIASSCDGDDGDDSGDDEGSSCVSRDATACTPLYEPTWDRVYTQTIIPRCGAAGSACHAESSATGAGGGLVIGDMEATRSALVDHGFVVPSDAACSDMVVRLDTDDDLLRMPPGAGALDETERCAVAQWVENGAAP